MSVAVITGAAGAIGTAIARRLARDGLLAFCVDRSEAVEEVCAGIRLAGGEACPHLGDLNQVDDLAAIAAAARGLGRVSVLVNNAGITRDGRAGAISEEDFRAVVRVNAVSPLRLAEALAPALADGGSIVNVASRAALGNFGQVNYVCSKSALVGATRALAVRLAPRVRVNCVAPGLVDTPMTQAMPAEVLAKLTARVPLGRAAEAEEIADVVAFLGSSEAEYVTGQMLVACGGRSVAG